MPIIETLLESHVLEDFRQALLGYSLCVSSPCRLRDSFSLMAVQDLP